MAYHLTRRFLATRGSVVVEAALCFPVLMLCFASFVDLGRANYGRARMANGVSAGVQYAYLTGSSVNTASAKSLIEGVANVKTGGVSQVTATVAAPACYCINGAAGAVTKVVSACNVYCADGVLAGTYTSISASYTFTPLLPGLASFIPTTYTTSTLVQLK